jgi:hypothetical protein
MTIADWRCMQSGKKTFITFGVTVKESIFIAVYKYFPQKGFNAAK